MKSYGIVPALLAGLLLAGAAIAADKPDFSGQWKLNIAKSDFGQMPAPTSGASKVEHKDPTLKVSTTIVGEQGEFKIEGTYSTDGKPTTNKFFGESEAKSVAKWDGPVLVIDSKVDMNGNEMTTAERWTLSADGKVLTRAMAFTFPQGEGKQTQIFEKE